MTVADNGPSATAMKSVAIFGIIAGIVILYMSFDLLTDGMITGFIARGVPGPPLRLVESEANGHPARPPAPRPRPRPQPQAEGDPGDRAG
jgi:hypothetical protein